MKILVRLAKVKSKTVIATIHQPRSSVFEMFDKLILLDRGRVVYFGPAKEGANYFDRFGREKKRFEIYKCFLCALRLGFGVPPLVNPPDHFVDVLMSPERGPQVKFADIFLESPEFDSISKAISTSMNQFQSLEAEKTGRYTVSSFTQYKQVRGLLLFCLCSND